jgi:hypothetical protein
MCKEDTERSGIDKGAVTTNPRGQKCNSKKPLNIPFHKRLVPIENPNRFWEKEDMRKE